MKHTPTSEDLNLLRQKVKTIYCKIDLLEKDMSVLDSLEGLTISGSLTVDADSDVRRTFNSTIYLNKKSNISRYSPEDWANKFIRVYIGLEGKRESIAWYDQGVFAFNQNGFVYNETEHTLNLSCVDLVATLNGTLGGTLTGYQTRIPAGSDIQQAILQTFYQSGLNDCRVNYWNRTVPYDLEYGAGVTIWDILKELRDLYYPFEMYFDGGTFFCSEIPNGQDELVVIDSGVLENLVIGESATVDYSEIKNCVEVFGAVIEADGVGTLTSPDVNNILGSLQYAFGNVDVFSRNKIVWTEAKVEEYRNIIDGWGIQIAAGNVSTVEAILKKVGNLEVACCPLVQPRDGGELIPVSIGDLDAYLSEIAAVAEENGGINADNLIAADKVGAWSADGQKLFNMLLAVEGQTVNGAAMTAADVGAVAGLTANQIKSRYGNVTSKYVGYGAKAYFDMLRASVSSANAGTLTLYVDQVDLAEKDKIAFRLPAFADITVDSFTISIVNSLASTIKTYPDIPLYQYTGNNSDPDTLYNVKGLRGAETYVIRYVRNHQKFQFMGQQMTHAMVKLVDRMPDAAEIEKQKKQDNCSNMKFVVLTDQGEDSLYNSRFSIEKIGQRTEVLAGGEYDNYMTDSAVLSVAEYEHWKRCRLTDTIDISCVLVPWLDVNQKVAYTPRYLNANIQLEYMIKKINIELGSGTMSMTLSRFFPLYPFIVENKY